MLMFCKLVHVDDCSVLNDVFLDEELHQPQDVALHVPLDNKRTIKIEIHILYSNIWEAPDLYLQASWTDTGEILEIDRFCLLINKPVPKLLTRRVCFLFNSSCIHGIISRFIIFTLAILKI